MSSAPSVHAGIDRIEAARPIASGHPPIRTLRDIEELERVPLERRIGSWNVNDWIRRGWDHAPQKTAIHFLENADPDEKPLSITFEELRHRSNQAANLFHSLGVRSGGAVLFLLPSVLQQRYVQFGALAAGIACPINWMLGPAQLIELIRGAGTKVLVALGPTPGYEIWENLESIRDQIPASVRVLSVHAPAGRALPDTDFDDLASKQPGERLVFERSVVPEDIAAYVHSGGTTGSPKLVKLTHRGFSYKCWASTVAWGLDSTDTVFASNPLFHIAGFFSRGIQPVVNSMTMVIPSPLGARNKNFVANHWKLVEKYRITQLHAVPTTLSVLAKNPPRGEDISSLRPYGMTGSSALPVEVAKEIESMVGVRVLMTYGATEYTQNVTQPPRDGEPRYGSTGFRLPHTHVKAVKLDRHGEIERECALGEPGVLIVKGPSVTPGYIDPKYNANLFTRDGWFRSGDMGRFDADGYLWLTGRVRDLIIRGGHNIEPAIIEETLLKHPEVLLAAAVGKPDAYAGELPVAYVQLVKGSSATGPELAAFALDHITERAAAPKEVVILEEMPLTDIQKPSKLRLRYDAARRTFCAVLAEALSAVDYAVEVGPDETHGTRATIRVWASGDEAKRELDRKIREIMKSYAIHYSVQYTETA